MSEQPVNAENFLEKAELGLGAWSWGDRVFWQYGHGYTDKDCSEAFNISLTAGVNLIDTAEYYGSGRSERLVGKFIKEAGKPVLVATKFFPMPYRFGKNAALRAMRGSLERLGLEKVDLYQLHWPRFVGSNDTFIEGLALVCEAGLTKMVGISNHDEKLTRQAQKVLSKHGIKLASNQMEYSLLDRKIEKDGLLDYCKENNIRLIAYSPIAKGMLTGKYNVNTPPPGPRGRKYAGILKSLDVLINLLKEIGAGHAGKTPTQVALNWVICKGALPIPGAKTAKQAEENSGAIGWRLSENEIRALDKESDKIL